MKIGYDAKRAFHNRSGLGNFSRDLIRIISSFANKNEYVLYNPKTAKIKFSLNENTTEVLPSSIFWKIFSSVWRQKGILKQIKKDKIDIFHGLSGEIPQGIHKMNIKTAVTIHDLIFMRFPELYNPIDRKIYFKKFKYAADKADVVIAISEETKKDIVHFLNIPPKKVSVIYQGCNKAFKEIYPTKTLEQTRTKFNIPNSFVLNVGTIQKRKNLLNLIKAIETLDIDLVVVGNDKRKYTNTVKEYINKKNLNHRVHFLKNVSTEELAHIYQLANIFVYPSIFEGFGIPIIEALYSRTPVITSKGSCFPEAGGPDSIYIDPKNVNELKTEIENLLVSEEKRKLMITKGLEYAKKFDDEHIAEQHLAIYNALI